MNRRIPLILGFLLLLTALWLQTTTSKPVVRFITTLENLAYDMQLRAKIFAHAAPTIDAVAIVDIDDESIRQEGRWPWPRAKLAALITQLRAQGAAVVAIDMIFPEPEKNIVYQVLNELKKEKNFTPTLNHALQKIAPFFNDDIKFADSLQSGDSVLGLTFLTYREHQSALPPALFVLKTADEKALNFFTLYGAVGNIPLLQTAAKRAGFLNVFPDDDGIVRRIPLLLRYQDNLYPSLALEAVSLYLLSPVHLVQASYGEQLRLEGIKLANRFIPTDSKGQVIIPFVGKSFTFPYYSATKVLHNQIPTQALSGKIVFIGISATGLADVRATAVQGIFPGVEIQATLAHGLLTGNFSYKPPWSQGAEITMTLALGITLIFLFPFLGPRSLGLLIIALPLFLVLLNNWLWEKTGLLVAIFIPILFVVILAGINILYGYLFETRRRERLKNMFGQYVPAKHIDTMLSQPENYGLYGEERDMTVLFADIRNFTTLSETLTAAQLKDMLGDFFTPMTEIIFRHHGTIDKYVGDLIMAFWGAPLKDKRHAQHAMLAALDMQREVEKLKVIFVKKGWPDINIGIGVNSGIMRVGDMGSKFRRNYTVLGNAVNVAARLESLTKYYGVKIIVSAHTKATQNKCIFRQLDRVRVKGKKTIIEIYELLCRDVDLTSSLQEEITQHQLGLEHYFKQEWESAEIIFTALNQQYPKKLYKLYLDRLATFAKNPPPSDWDGAYTHTIK